MRSKYFKLLQKDIGDFLQSFWAIALKTITLWWKGRHSSVSVASRLLIESKWVVQVATLVGNQSQRSKFRLDQSESRIWPMWLFDVTTHCFNPRDP